MMVQRCYHDCVKSRCHLLVTYNLGNAYMGVNYDPRAELNRGPTPG